MSGDDSTLRITFRHSGTVKDIALAHLVDAVVRFLDQMGTSQFISPELLQRIGPGNGNDRFANLMAACGYPEDPGGFFSELLEHLGKGDNSANIAIQSLQLPHHLLVAVLEVVLPGHGFHSIKTVDQLEQTTHIPVPEEHRADMQRVLDTYPVRLSMHTIRQMLVSRAVAYQYLPFIEELDLVGHTNTWIGQFHQGLLEQMYQNRVIFLLNMSCPVYCRFCFRKHKESRNEANPTPDDVLAAVAHVSNTPTIKEVVVTGGDPFMSRINMATTIDSLMAIEHVQTLRLATRSIAYYPDLFLADDGKLLRYLKLKHLALQERGKRLEIATHFIHPDEISPQSLQIITELVTNGILVYVQTPFLDGCNDEGPELVRLFSQLRGAGAELHYIYIPCSPIHGNSIYWSPISKGHAAAAYLRAHVSDRIVPRICTATPIGKMDWHTSGWAVEPVAENDNFIWIRSPYTPDYFKAFAPLANELDNIRVNEEGTIDIQYMAQIGDETLFLGPRPKRGAAEDKVMRDPASLPLHLLANQGKGPSLVATVSTRLARTHATRVEVDGDLSAAELDSIAGDERITDVIAHIAPDPVRNLGEVKALARKLKAIPHVNSLRLRSLAFNHRPLDFTAVVVDQLADLNSLTIVNPLRLEIETQFLVAEEITEEHERLVRRLRDVGITVYNNTPLLGTVNDAAEIMQRLAYRCREADIEFHHLFVAGDASQVDWNREHPVDLHDVVDIATTVRREGSGREIPRYIIKTGLGEVDFGLTSAIIGSGTDLKVKLSPYKLDYYRSLAAEFQWPDTVAPADDGSPLVPLTGLRKTTDHPLF